MRVFQTCFFIIGIIFYLILGCLLETVFSLSLDSKKITTKKRTSKERQKYIDLKSIYERILEIRYASPGKVIIVVIVMSITIWLVKPYVLDIPQLITGKFNYVTAEVEDIRHFNKDPMEYVYLSNGKRVDFFFSSGVSRYKKYKIGYLTHTNRGIYCEEIDESNSHRTVIGFPFKDILGYLAALGVIFFLIFISPYVKLILFIPVNIISVPVFIYYFIKYRIDNGIWFSSENRGFVFLMFALVIILTTLFGYFIEKAKSDDCHVIYVFAQVFSICELVFLICLIFNLD
ncbi:hypothetical protein [Clostridium sp. JS66]|uniref:hypothetical protein n=1 Tax=Clostridium sp. JS66 TaxID=3064705 RepID=UPI00298E8100|nr:hypothetical protein [Clostridium sp. JS66]WPC41192.1 hypothetical protein Q6H37_25375 [Clostridium sp. JS66]